MQPLRRMQHKESSIRNYEKAIEQKKEEDEIMNQCEICKKRYSCSKNRGFVADYGSDVWKNSCKDFIFNEDRIYATHGTNEIVCPHCGYIWSDSREFDEGGDGELDCENCKNEFFYSVNFTVRYTTKKKGKTE